MGRDVVLVHGIEPNMRWRGFAAELVQAFTDLGVQTVVLLGALLADSPHTRPVPVAAAASDPELAADLHVEPVEYKGPTGIVGVLQHACTQAGHRGRLAVGRRAALCGPAAQPEGHAGPAPRRGGRARRVAAAG